jgi:hypothetical protein
VTFTGSYSRHRLLTNVTQHDWSQFSVEAADLMVAEAVCRWPQAIGFDPVVDGVDYSIVTRNQLWPIVSGAARRLRGVRGFYELQLRDRQAQGASKRRLQNWCNRSLHWLTQWPVRTIRQLSGRPTILMPFAHRRWRRTQAAILDSGCNVVSELPFVDHLNRRRLQSKAADFATTFVDRLVSGLQHLGIDVDNSRRAQLLRHIAASRVNVQLAVRMLTRDPPYLLITNTSATSPTIEYVLAAQTLNVRTLAIQYGLDCDRYAYDDAHAQNIAVWSGQRRQ